MPSSLKPATISAEAFERGARLLAERWNAADGGVGCAARWVEETDPTRKRVAANGYLAVEEHHAETEADAKAEAEAEAEADEFARVDATEDVDDASAPFSAPSSAPGRAHVRTYHAAYSPSYRAPVLLIKARWVAAPSRALTHAELERALLRAAGAVVGADVGADVNADAGCLLVDGLDGLTAFAPWEHPHSGRDAGGCWTGAHPCETAKVMALLLATDPTVRKNETDVDDGVRGDDGEHRFEDDEGALRYMIAWARLATSAVRDFPVPASLQ